MQSCQQRIVAAGKCPVGKTHTQVGTAGDIWILIDGYILAFIARLLYNIEYHIRLAPVVFTAELEMRNLYRHLCFLANVDGLVDSIGRFTFFVADMRSIYALVVSGSTRQPNHFFRFGKCARYINKAGAYTHGS